MRDMQNVWQGTTYTLKSSKKPGRPWERVATDLQSRLAVSPKNHTHPKGGFLLMSAFMRLDWSGLDWLFLLINWTNRKVQWGTKVLTHFRKMAPFCIVDILIPFPCLPQPLPPKINVEFWTLKSFFYFRQHWFGGSGDLRPLKGMK